METSKIITNLELEVASCKQKVALGKHTAKIHTSTEWNEVINKGYYTQELNSLTQQLPLVTGEEKELIVMKIAAIGSLQNYMTSILNQSTQAQDELDSLENELNHQRGLL